ncbi:hypothetical protein [Methylobacterium radiotolerans]|jgi:hypothetical protein|uniref:hypothetical protein n=1 Tax=Methylobacterium radiotolerans TaxID=31998 RepID=UPI0038D0D23B
MAAPSILPMLSAALEAYLEEAQRDWEAQGGRQPTLPVTDGKVNVRQIVRSLGARDPRIKPGHEQHFFKKPELRLAVNAVAEQQELALIGSRSPEEGYDVVQRRIGKLAGEASELRQAMAEREAVIDSLRRENSALREQLALLEQTGMVVRTGPARG